MIRPLTRRLRLTDPPSHVTERPVPYDWAKRDPDLADDREYVGHDGWLRTTVG